MLENDHQSSPGPTSLERLEAEESLKEPNQLGMLSSAK